MDENPQIAAELERFFEADRHIPEVSPASLDRILSRVESVAAAAAVAPLAVSGVAGLTTKAAVALGVVTFGVGAAFGGGVVWTLQPATQPMVPDSAPNVAEEVAPVDDETTDDETIFDELTVDEPTLDDVTIDEPLEPRAVQPEQETAPPAEEGPSTPRAERRLLEAARAALSRNRPEDASRILQRHRRRYRTGTLAEERSILEIEAAFAARRWPAVENLAGRFPREHPNSLYRARISRFRSEARTHAEESSEEVTEEQP